MQGSVTSLLYQPLKDKPDAWSRHISLIGGRCFNVPGQRPLSERSILVELFWLPPRNSYVETWRSRGDSSDGRHQPSFALLSEGGLTSVIYRLRHYISSLHEINAQTPRKIFIGISPKKKRPSFGF